MDQHEIERLTTAAQTWSVETLLFNIADARESEVNAAQVGDYVKAIKYQRQVQIFLGAFSVVKHRTEDFTLAFAAAHAR
jgi:hypothetical protein